MPLPSHDHTFNIIPRFRVYPSTLHLVNDEYEGRTYKRLVGVLKGRNTLATVECRYPVLTWLLKDARSHFQLEIIKSSSVSLNSKGYSHAVSLVKAGKVNRTASWSFSAADGNALLGSSDNPDWEKYSSFHLGIDPSQPKDTKGHYKYPYGKGGSVYASGVRAARSRSAQQGAKSIFDAAGRLLDSINKKD